MLVHTRPAPVAPASTAWGWRSGPCIALGHRFELFSENVDDFRLVFDPILAPLRGADAPPHLATSRYEIRRDGDEVLPFTMYFDGDRVAGGRVAADLVGIFTWHVNRAVIERTVDSHVLLHSAAAVRGGVTVILPADQESGKTTTVAGLLRSGFDYVTDEAVALDPISAWVTPFPKSLSLDPGSWALFAECRPMHSPDRVRQWQVPACSLGAHVVRHVVPPPRVIVFPKYVAGADTTVLPLSKAEAVHELARMSFDFPRHASRNLATLGRVSRHATAARLVIGSLSEAIDAIDAIVSEKLMEEL